ncbi:anti-sigma B factor RsbW [Pseudalkalibacillus berkeleyi]|uniref:Serine-protein kinase RsbW n=1 Tax=Pseudalkalibacillus berkeleyi TaxID=1069813 RepID=A0ABS9H5H2_9BACL|nr:anti-sigma B factor RsbW [Pseudalkalibacillus berkeleyi]MCF6139346.1 anti-sigma B factor RsbW [Pseudalkalibacillus berkeleyi]
MSDMIEMVIPAKPDFVGVARLTVSGIASRMGYTFDEIEDIKIAISEAITNAVNHAYVSDEDGEIRLSYGKFEDKLEITVMDKGKSFDVNEIKETTGPVNGKPVEQINEGGLGLFLIETLMDEVNIREDAGVVVMMTKYLNRDGVDESVDQYKQAPSQ